MAPISLEFRLRALADSYKQTFNLIQELKRFPAGAVFTTETNPDEKRLELGNEIHQNLKELEDALEFLQQETEDGNPQQHRRDSYTYSHERERNAATISRLDDDIKLARVAFRKAQLQAKRNAETSKRKEREELFADRLNTNQIPGRRDGQKKLTQDELALNAAEDVTKSLRRAHNLLAGNLQQSQFAQQTLDESQQALRGLADSYGGTTDLLKSSRGLVSQLVRSQKSDTWFLMSSVYLLAVTLAWLIFRRLLYGPMWWLLWQPLKMLWYFTFASLGAVGFGGASKSVDTSAGWSLSSRGIPTNSPGFESKHVPLPPKGGGWGGNAQPPVSAGTDVVDEIRQIVAETEGRVPLSERDPQISPTNRKKRMYEGVQQDEL